MDIQPYSGKFIYNPAPPEVCVTLVYMGPWHIQNQSRVKNSSIFKTLVYSRHWKIQNPSIFRTTGAFH